MDFDSSSKFISSLAKFLQSLCNGYVEFDNGVEVIGHIYLNVDTGKKIDYVLNEKVCKTDQNSVTFISNSFHATPAEKPKPAPVIEKPVEQDKISDPGGNDEIMILDDGETRTMALELRDDDARTATSINSSPHPKSHRPTKRPHSFTPSQRQSGKLSRLDPSTSSLHNPSNGAHHNDSLHSSSSHIPIPQDSLSADPDASHSNPPVFPQKFNDSSHEGSIGKDVKQEPDPNLHVKQEYDPSEPGVELEPYDESQDPSLYGSFDQYYNQGPGRPGQGEFFQGTGDPGEMGDATDLQSLSRYRQCHCSVCGQNFRDSHTLIQHQNSVHYKIQPYACEKCGKLFSYRSNRNRHMVTCQKLSTSS